ncbi:MAG: hypothetical protein GY711_08975 [bacterium]|nr:hypothetical protein [bacterium]
MRRSSYILLATLCPLLASEALAQCELVKLTPADNDPADEFGDAVDISGFTMVVGARADAAPPAAGTGSAYVYDYDPTAETWTMVQKLTPPDPDPSKQFGRAVAIDGTTLFVGAPAHDGAAGTGFFQGSVYVYERDSAGTWVLQQQIFPSDAADGDGFGHGIDVDGDVAFVGSPTNGPTNEGSVYGLVRGITGIWILNPVLQLTATPPLPFSQFGLALSLEGSRLVVGSPTAGAGDSGRAYVFEGSGAIWTQTALLAPSAGPRFGDSVSLSGDVVAIGSPEYSGCGVCNRIGAASIFRFDGASWTREALVQPSDGVTGDRFGSAVALEGGELVVCADGEDGDSEGAVTCTPGIGSAYQYRYDGTTWQEISKFFPRAPEPWGGAGFRASVDAGLLALGAAGSSQVVDAVYAYRMTPFATPFCYCASAAPCGNEWDLAGCKNSLSTASCSVPGRLVACGTSSVAGDDLVLRAFTLPNEFGFFVTSEATRNPLAINDGLLCVGQPFYRLDVRQITGNTMEEPPGIVARAGLLGAQVTSGSTWNFQGWYRDSGGPCGTGSNLTNALAVVFAP